MATPTTRQSGVLWIVKPGGAGHDKPTAVAVCKASALLEEIGQLKAIHFASPTARQVLDLCEDIARLLQTEALALHAESAKAKGKEAREGRDDTARSYTQFAHQLRGWLRFIVSADNTAPVADLVAPFEALAKQHASGAEVLIRPQWKYNFTYRHFAELLYSLCQTSFDWTEQEFNKVASDHKFVSSDEDLPHIAVLSYAGIERRNALALVMIAHEIGHLLDEHFGLTSGPEVRGALTQAADEQKDAVSSYLKSRQKREVPAASVEGLKEEAGFWIRELVADVAALRLIGPAYICALKLSAYALTAYETLPPKHPPLEDRLNWVMCESAMKGLGHMEFFAKHSKLNPCAGAMLRYLKSLTKEIAQPKQGARTSPVTRDEERKKALLRTLSRPATEKALARLRDKVLPDAESFKLSRGVFEMVEKLAREVPPCQSYVRGLKPDADKKRDPNEQHFSMAAILNAGWMFYLTHVMKVRNAEHKDAEGNKIDPETVELLRVSDLVTLAVKQSSFLEEYTRRAAQNPGC